ncbi:MAG: DEAD/DEAH box helicase [Candidatus Asgardarchaeia archaeon]
MPQIESLRLLDVSQRIIDVLKKNGIHGLRGFQYLSLHAILTENKNVLVASPSGSGKTLVGEIALVNSALNGKKGIYTSPYRAICNEKYERFKKLYAPLGLKIGISTGDFSFELADFDDIDILICTYERFDSVLRHLDPEKVKAIEYVVVDEIHNVGEQKRGPRLESWIARLLFLYPEIKIIGLSATIANPDTLANWLNAELIINSKRPVPLEYKIINIGNKNAYLIELAEKAITDDKSLIIFTARRKDAESLALKLARIAEVKVPSDIKSHLAAFVDELYNRDEYQTRLARKLLSVIRKGVAFHHAGLDYPQRALVESLFLERKIKILVGTTTLGAGINVPAAIVVVRDPSVPNYIVSLNGAMVQEHVIMTPLSANNIHQMLGRAGRPGYEEKGLGIILVSTEAEGVALLHKYFDPRTKKPKYDSIDSQMDADSLMEAILALICTVGGADVNKLLEYLRHTLYFKQNKFQQDEINSLLELTTLNVSGLIKLNTEPNEFIVARQYSDKDISIIRISKTLIEALVKNIPCGFSSKPYCNCKIYQKLSIEGKLCRHLAGLSLYLAKKYPEIAYLKLPKIMHYKSPLQQLMLQQFVYEADGMYYCTDLGMHTVKLYFHPQTALYLKYSLHKVSSIIDFLLLINRVVALESHTQTNQNYSSAIFSLIRGDSFQQVIDRFDIAPGDLENYLNVVKWAVNAVTTFAGLLGLLNVKEIGEQIQISLANLLK